MLSVFILPIFIFAYLPLLDISYKWNDTMYVTFCVWLLSCSMSSKLLHMYQYLVPFLLTVIYFWVCGVFIGAHGLLSSCGGQGNGNPPQYSSLQNPMDRGAWQSIGFHRVGHNWSNLAQQHLGPCVVGSQVPGQKLVMPGEMPAWEQQDVASCYCSSQARAVESCVAKTRAWKSGKITLLI